MTIQQFASIVSIALKVGFFALMGFGLLVASIMLFYGKLSGGEWVTVCGILFGSDRIGFALSEFGKGSGNA